MLMTKAQQRSLQTLHEDLAKKMHELYTEINGVLADVDIAFVDQTTYAELIASLSRPSASYTFSVPTFGKGSVILDYSLPIAYSLLEYAGAGKPMAQMQAAHRGALAAVFKRDLANIESIWSPVIDIKGSDAEFETNPEALDIAQDNDHVALIGFEVDFPQASGKINLCYPIALLESVLPKLSPAPASTL
jgi:flagellar motor switch protein FliM